MGRPASHTLMAYRDLVQCYTMGRITVLPEGKSGPLRTGETLLFHLQQLGVHIPAGCGGTGECGNCRVRILSGTGSVSPPSAVEKKLPGLTGWRLACQAIVLTENEHIIAQIREPGPFSIIEGGIHTEFLKDPAVGVRETDGQRVIVRDEHISGTPKGRCAGISLDAGTTTLVIRWYDLEGADCTPLATASLT